MVYIDIHCHLEFFPKTKVPEIINKAENDNIKIILYNSIDPKTMRLVLKYSKDYSIVKANLGIYPTECLKLTDKKIDSEIDFIRQNKEKIIGIGEVGIDLKESSDFIKQRKNFIEFIKLAKELNLSLTVHSRKAEEECIEILEEHGCKKVIMHCFCGNLKSVKRIIDNGWFLSIPTNVTFNEHFQKVAKLCPIEQLFCETDSPFLHPIKGEKNNEPANVICSYKKISEIRVISLKEVENQIERNFNKIFSITI